ncbi:MAG TPA: hypothetical protein VE010_00125 [Thermoanaerobaculia bacterium]|nr:hypothetical protein [Thermoanaerobaculia bacterium]
MNHLSQEDLILNYYRELDSRAHLDACAECRGELARLASVLDSVVPIEVPEPDDAYEAQVWNRLSWRLRGERRKSASWVTKYAAIAATVAIAFSAGLLVTNRNQPAPVKHVATTKTPQEVQPVSQAAGDTTQQQRDRILLVVVGDHFDESERVLVELTNLTPDGEVDIASEQKRAEELLASNRLYRRTAIDRGEENVATLLDELEPVLMQIAHSPSQVSANELRRMQKRVEAKGLVFKLRVVRAGVRSEAKLPIQPSI